MFTFPVSFWSAGVGSRTYITSSTSTATATSFTFNGVACGTAQGISLVVVVAQGANTGGAGFAINTITLNGGGSTLVTSNALNVGGSGAAVAIASGAVAGTTVNVVVTFAQNSSGCAIQVYRLNNLISGTATATAAAHNNTGNSTSTTINIPDGGILILGAGVEVHTPTISGATQDAAGTAGSVTTYCASSQDHLAAQTGRPISASWAGGFAGALAGVSWN